ncbi:hypothetical protein NESM_000496100 [Novymonas esmeraldas]|uniref:Uncharacterized protein n=1 Tax=Novymonas esmeraldas TaxID=1808958 RepID=A0AAW0ESM5_9TRYP
MESNSPPLSTRLHSGSRSGPTASPPGPARGGATPPPQRPRLFARAGAARGSPPPPARLAPLSPTTPPLPAPPPQPLLRIASDSLQRISNSSSFSEEERGICGSDGAVTRPPLSSSVSPYDGSLPRAVGVLSAMGATAGPNSAPPSARVEPLLLHRTSPASAARRVGAVHGGGSGGGCSASPIAASTDDVSSGAAAGVAEAWVAAQNTSAAAVSLLHAVGSSKRHRIVSSADTQHSLTSSTLPPPRCRRALGQGGVDEAPALPPAGDSDASATSTTCALPVAAAPRVLDSPNEEEAADGAPPRCGSSDSACSSRGAMSYCASSAHASATGVPEELVVVPPRTEAAAEAQCLVLDDSVDTAAVVTQAQLRQLKAEAALTQAPGHTRGDGLATPYHGRLISPDVLRDWTGWEDLELVLTTQLRVDADAMLGVDQMAAQLPRLCSLRLSGSRIPRVRQLGTGFHALRHLWLNSCHVTDLGGIAACCPSLVELYLPFNHVSDAAPLMALSATLEVLDMEANLLESAADVGVVLAALRGVRTLSLLGNPLTCAHQTRVRAAYHDALVESSGGPSSSSSMQHAPFVVVLAAWVRLLMPQLETLNDAPLLESGGEDNGGVVDAELGPRHSALPASVHVDPLDAAVAAELRLVEACVRDADAFDPLVTAVEEANQHTYTRPSTSCNGARPRLAPTTAMGAARPSTSLWSMSSLRLGSCGDSVADASALTTGAALAGSATTSLRRRQATPSTPPPHDGALRARGRAGGTRLGTWRDGAGLASSTATSAVSVDDDDDDDARVAALLADDSEEEEWEQFKSSLLLKSSSVSSTSVSSRGGHAVAAAAVTRSLNSAVRSHDEEGAAAVGVLQADGFDKELRTELARLRMRMAKASRE